jgi:hypothetical protein
LVFSRKEKKGAKGQRKNFAPLFLMRLCVKLLLFKQTAIQQHSGKQQLQVQRNATPHDAI